jgi:hypothetical protein
MGRFLPSFFPIAVHWMRKPALTKGGTLHLLLSHTDASALTNAVSAGDLWPAAAADVFAMPPHINAAGRPMSDFERAASVSAWRSRRASPLARPAKQAAVYGGGRLLFARKAPAILGARSPAKAAGMP